MEITTEREKRNVEIQRYNEGNIAVKAVIIDRYKQCIALKDISEGNYD